MIAPLFGHLIITSLVLTARIPLFIFRFLLIRFLAYMVLDTIFILGAFCNVSTTRVVVLQFLADFLIFVQLHG